MQVRTVFREEPFEMPEDEAEVLRSQGLLREDKPQPAPRPAPPAVTSPKE